MPDSVVQIEGVGNVQFPSSMSDEEIGQAAHKLYTGAGAKSIEANPPSVKPPSSIPEHAPGKTNLTPLIQEDEASARVAGMPGGSPITAPATDTMAKVAGGTIGAAGLVANAPAIGGALLGAAKAAPTMALMEGINYARSHLPGGKYIPPGAELLPLFLGGGKGKGAAIERDATRSNVPYASEAEAVEAAPEVQGKTAIASSAEPAIQTAPKVTQKKVGDLLNEGLGGKPLTPNVPLRQQGRAIPTEGADMPTGHTAVESSAIKSYKYDPATREFEFVSPSGAHYIHGDVSPEQMADFEKASSKGKAFNEIKRSSTYVGKIVNGKRVAVKPSRNLASASPD